MLKDLQNTTTKEAIDIMTSQNHEKVVEIYRKVICKTMK